ncbi:hypothetical protein GCM10011506_47660 [Marivirga lumbricoides]|uniref:Uncharacterized protein n=1 Tax=Marivirga lumbricoides TaxID=1046115 RepID=A0ABQ1N742_9BACT|nr:hypothetical protein GCM10011506_47660 [Marivirga lumbricoides]
MPMPNPMNLFLEEDFSSDTTCARVDWQRNTNRYNIAILNRLIEWQYSKSEEDYCYEGFMSLLTYMI